MCNHPGAWLDWLESNVSDTTERWLPVVGYEGFYEVSSHARVRSLPRKKCRGTILKPTLDRGVAGYLKVGLSANGVRKSCPKLHVLVATAFLGPRPPGLEIRHLDGDSRNCRVDNLAYGTKAENDLDRKRHGKSYLPRSTFCGRGHEPTPANIYRAPDRPKVHRCLTCLVDDGKIDAADPFHPDNRPVVKPGVPHGDSRYCPAGLHPCTAAFGKLVESSSGSTWACRTCAADAKNARRNRRMCRRADATRDTSRPV